MEFTRDLEIHDPIKQEINLCLLFVRYSKENNGMVPSVDHEIVWELGHLVSSTESIFQADQGLQ